MPQLTRLKHSHGFYLTVLRNAYDISLGGSYGIGWAVLPSRLSVSGIFFQVGNRAIAQAILQGSCLHFSRSRRLAHTGKASRNFHTFADGGP